MNRTRFASALAMAALAAILLPTSVHAQITFERTYGGSDDDYGWWAQQTADGGYVIVGNTRSSGAGSEDVWLIKTNALGDTEWTRTFGDTADDYGVTVQETADGGYIIGGYTASFGAGEWDIWLVKTDAVGNTLWSRTCGGTADDYGGVVRQTTDGGYVATGHTSSFGAGYYDIFAIKTDAVGDTQWTRTFGGGKSDFGGEVQQTADGNYVVAGCTDPLGAGYRDACLIKTDANGDTLWTRTYHDTTDLWGYSVQQTADGGYIMAGSVGPFESNEWDLHIIRVDARGDPLWTRTYGTARDDHGGTVGQTPDAGFIVGGYTSSFGAGCWDIWLVKTDSAGDMLWYRTFGGAADDYGGTVQRTADDGYIITGSTMSFGAGNFDVYLVKTDSLGNVAVAEPKTSPPRASPLALTCEPNPFRARTAIRLQLAADGPAQLTVFDASGRWVRKLAVNLTSCATWDGTDELGQPLPSGAYFMRLDAGGQHATTRVVLQR